MLKLSLRYARYAIAALGNVAFGIVLTESKARRHRGAWCPLATHSDSPPPNPAALTSERQYLSQDRILFSSLG